MNSRRKFLKNTALGIAGSTFLISQKAERKSSKGKFSIPEKIRLGIASYSLRNFNRSDTIKMIKEIGAINVNIKSFHLPKDYTVNQLRNGRKEFEDAGLNIVGGGTIALRQDDEDFIRSRFEYAHVSGMPLMVIAPTPATLPKIEQFVKEYDIKVAIHNHGPEDAHFSSPQVVLEHIKDMDPRVGICNDLGHTARTGVDIIESLEVSGNRLFDIHMKDLKDLRDNNTQSIIGEGKMPVADIFYQLIKMNYCGYVNLEYEIEAADPLTGMKQSFSYMKGVIDGLDKTISI